MVVRDMQIKTTLRYHLKPVKMAIIKKSEDRRDSRWCSENNPGLKLSVNAQWVSQGRISRRIFVSHRTWKFSGIKETWDARQRSWLV